MGFYKFEVIVNYLDLRLINILKYHLIKLLHLIKNYLTPKIEDDAEKILESSTKHLKIGFHEHYDHKIVLQTFYVTFRYNYYNIIIKYKSNTV